jgi:hypothetical protein
MVAEHSPCFRSLLECRRIFRTFRRTPLWRRSLCIRKSFETQSAVLAAHTCAAYPSIGIRDWRPA